MAINGCYLRKLSLFGYGVMTWVMFRISSVSRIMSLVINVLILVQTSQLFHNNDLIPLYIIESNSIIIIVTILFCL